MDIFKIGSLLVFFSLSIVEITNSEIHKVGRRQKGDTILFKKTLSTEWTFNLTTHNLTHEYVATEPVTSIEYQTMKKVKSEILFTSENSILAVFSTSNVNNLVVTISVFGYHEQYTPSTAKIILYNMQEFIQKLNRYNSYNIFSIGKRQYGDDVQFYSTKRSIESLEPAKHSIDINVNIEYFITYIEILINTNAANVAFAAVTKHSFQGIVSASNVRQLMAKVQIYGYLPKEVPSYYEPFFYSGQINGDHVIRGEDNSTEIILISSQSQTLCFNFLCIIFVLFTWI